MTQWYKELFNNYAETYDREGFTFGTSGEVDFIEIEIDYDKSLDILDIGCGTGRHAIELAKRGYKVTGVDLSVTQLEKARNKAEEANLNVAFIEKDACKLDFDTQFHLVIMICEGAFPLMETDEKNFQILKGAANALKSGGKIIFTTLSVLFALSHSLEGFINAGIKEGKSIGNRFDMMTFRDYSTFEVADDNGNKKTLKCNERHYAPSEIDWYLKSLGFEDIGIFGCQLGEFSREHKLTQEHPEMLVIAKKNSST
jgi:SAM-dependent methyltransferase